jgi:hypothetical protein
MKSAHASATFTGMKHCMNQPHVAPEASGKYSHYVDDLVARSSATLLPMNDRMLYPPGRRSFTPPAGRTHPFRPASCSADSTRCRTPENERLRCPTARRHECFTRSP